MTTVLSCDLQECKHQTVETSKKYIRVRNKLNTPVIKKIPIKLEKMISKLTQADIQYPLRDKRLEGKPVKVRFNGKLWGNRKRRQ